MSKARYTIEQLSGGQAGPYKDSHYHTRVTMEVMETWRGSTEWEPDKCTTEEVIIRRLKQLPCGFTDYKYDPKVDGSMSAYFTLRLDWLKMVSPGIWEFRTTSAFTD